MTRIGNRGKDSKKHRQSTTEHDVKQFAFRRHKIWDLCGVITMHLFYVLVIWFGLHNMDRIEYGRRGGSSSIGCWWVLGRCLLWGEGLIKARLQEAQLFCSTNWGCHCSSFKVHSWIKHMHRSVLVLAQITQTCNKLKKCSLNAKEDHIIMWN